ncbi:MAG: hypothetical protein HY247_02230 [archaeon]|nr:MAG: hypothetical protein HY247_02230 [archaeon]
MIASAASASASIGFWALSRLPLGETAYGAALAVGATVFYIVVTTPRRLLEVQALSQAREAVLLTASTASLLQATGSRSRTILTVHPRDQGVQSAVRHAGRDILLGRSPVESVRGPAAMLASYSAANALRSVAEHSLVGTPEGGEEVQGLENMGALSQETKFPILMAACFFTPILLLLFALFSGEWSPLIVSALVATEVVTLDLALHLCSTGLRRA